MATLGAVSAWIRGRGGQELGRAAFLAELSTLSSADGSKLSSLPHCESITLEESHLPCSKVFSQHAHAAYFTSLIAMHSVF